MNKITQAKQIIEGSTNLVKKIAGKADPSIEEVADDRFAICKQCPYLTIASTCQQCGCYMPSKTRVHSASCPVSKW
ncbi:hypothetical protein C900_05380 [Fulvivirga imtechensis AK7]|uniref:Uncharacterized protein n=1 Tax=Fulvivirga imtechensis AK7 TaxID=1237149 RepID=L8JNU6_9BACT|nr:DUF6171 family protein [Fulvivirga imtechensis]ELR69184.1 hypothetical protein C900_05380 [Fulvivirga imtechensis AK7]